MEDHPSLEACLDAVVRGGKHKENGEEGTVFVLDLSGASMIVFALGGGRRRQAGARGHVRGWATTPG